MCHCFLQNFVEPIDSIYLSCAIAKIIIQTLIIYLLAVYISNIGNILRFDFLLAAILITPLFQTSGFSRYIGLIDQSIIYTFFYVLSLAWLLLFFLPFFRTIYYNKKPAFNFAVKILLALFIIFLTLNGPLVPGVVLIVCPMVLLNIWMKNYKESDISPFYKRVLAALKKIPNYLMFYFVGICILSLYSLYIGRNNALNFGDSIPILERYLRLPSGIYSVVFQKLAFPILFLMIAINVIIIGKNYRSADGKKILKLVKWIGIFAIFYILLLPLGGFREYRSNIIRYDTIMPITFGLIFAFGFTSFYLIKNITGNYKKFYVMGIVLFLLLFTNADRLNTDSYECERHALETIAHSSEKVVTLNCDCPVMEWEKIYDASESELNARLFKYWNITTEKKLYFHKEN